MGSNRKARTALIQQFGGACQTCGYARCVRALQFHHTDAAEKAEWSKGRGHAAVKEVAAHPERFRLLCANCHFEAHEAEDQAKKRRVHCRRCGVLFASDESRDAHHRGLYCSRECLHATRSERALRGDSIAPRFHKYAQPGPTPADCWTWGGSFTRQYPTIPIVTPGGGRSVLIAARVGYELHRGPVPERGQLVRSCGNPGCVNPNHLDVRSAS